MNGNSWVVTGNKGPGWLVDAGGMTVATGGLTVITSGIAEDGNVIVAAGAVSIASPSSDSGIDVYASAPTFSGDVIRGAVHQSSTSNALLLQKDTTALFSVSARDLNCVAMHVVLLVDIASI